MKKEVENRETDDPNAISAEDQAVLGKKMITPTDVKDAFTGMEAHHARVGGMHAPTIAFKAIFGILLIITGVLTAIITSISIIGIGIGALFVISGLALAFLDIGGRETSHN